MKLFIITDCIYRCKLFRIPSNISDCHREQHLICFQSPTSDFSISIVINIPQNKTIIRVCCEKKPSKTKHTQLRKSNMKRGRRCKYKWLAFSFFLAHTIINWHSCGTLLHTIYQALVDEILINKMPNWNLKQLPYVWMVFQCLSFSFLLIHPNGHWYNPQQLGASIWYNHQLQIWCQPAIIQKPEIMEKCHYRFLHH